MRVEKSFKYPVVFSNHLFKYFSKLMEGTCYHSSLVLILKQSLQLSLTVQNIWMNIIFALRQDEYYLLLICLHCSLINWGHVDSQPEHTLRNQVNWSWRSLSAKIFVRVPSIFHFLLKLQIKAISYIKVSASFPSLFTFLNSIFHRFHVIYTMIV